MGTQTIEIQIRTLAMHRVAEHGAAAHWAYKGPDQQGGLAWLQVIREWHTQVDSALPHPYPDPNHEPRPLPQPRPEP